MPLLVGMKGVVVGAVSAFSSSPLNLPVSQRPTNLKSQKSLVNLRSTACGRSRTVAAAVEGGEKRRHLLFFPSLTRLSSSRSTVVIVVYSSYLFFIHFFLKLFFLQRLPNEKGGAIRKCSSVRLLPCCVAEQTGFLDRTFQSTGVEHFSRHQHLVSLFGLKIGKFY